MSDTPRVAFIGLGNMGGPMCINLHKAGHSVCAFDLSADAMDKVRQAGVATAASAAVAVQDAGVVISMLPASRHVEGLFLGSDGQEGLLPAIEPGALIIECSTIAPASEKKLARAAAARGLTIIDAPVSGGVGGAAAGTLTFIVGGEDAALERARPYLQHMGKNIFHMGPSGAGQVAKLCNNMALAAIMAVTGEAIALGVAHGLDPRTLSSMMNVSSSGSWVTNGYNPWPGVTDGAPASHGYEGGFHSDLMLKDLGLAVEAALSVGAAIPVGELARNLYALNHQQGRGELDFSSVVKLISDKP